MDSASIEQLCRPAAFDHATDGFTLRETHISWVILCGEYAYKLKKPVNFGFLDFSTLEQRLHYCEEELRLNRRFSPELYLDVVPVTGSPEGPANVSTAQPSRMRWPVITTSPEPPDSTGPAFRPSRNS